MKKFTVSTLFAAAALAVSMSAGATESNAVDKLPNGVEVQHLVKGTGAQPVASDHVRVHYEGTLNDGTVFDSTYKRGETITFPLMGVISCWTTGVATMNVGGVAILKCPSATAYGASGAGGVIGPNQDLTFKVELKEIVSK